MERIPIEVVQNPKFDNEAPYEKLFELAPIRAYSNINTRRQL